MEETFEEQKQETLDIHRYLSLVRRRHMYFLVPLLLGWIAVWSASWVLPPKYKSSTLILVQQPTVPKDYVQPNINDNLQDRLASMTQQILSRTRLLTIINRLNLYSGTDRRMTDDDKVAAMRKDIDVELVRGPQNQISSFHIFYTAREPHVAQDVTRALTDLFIKENLQTRQQQSENTTQFLKDQLAIARQSLSEQEAKVQAFQATHEGDLPSQQASNLQILSGLQSQLQNEQDSLNTARQQGAYLQAMVEQYKGLPASGQLAPASGQPQSPIAAVNQQLQQLRAKLADLRSRYTDRYPDVVMVEDQIARTEQLKDRLLAEESKQTKASQNGSHSQFASGDNTANPAVLQLQGELESNHLEIANREASIRSLKGRIDQYQARLNAQPVTEQKLAELTRGYNQSKSNYDDLLKKESDSEMATNMEQMQQGERFTMLDPPNLPVKPDFPNRLKFCGIGLAAGIALGVVVVGAFEFLDDRLQTEKEIKALLPVGILSDIPELKTPVTIQRNRARWRLGIVFGVFVVATIAAGSLYSYLRG